MFDHSATDLDGDSLVYEICNPYDGADQNIPILDNGSILQYPPPFQNVIFRSVPHTGSAARSRRSTTKSVKNSLSSSSSDGSDPEPAEAFGSIFPSCFCHINFLFNSFANNSFTEVAA